MSMANHIQNLLQFNSKISSTSEPSAIKANLIAQLTSGVRWTSCVQNMIADGADDFTECGPGKALQGMIGRIDKNVAAHGIV